MTEFLKDILYDDLLQVWTPEGYSQLQEKQSVSIPSQIELLVGPQHDTVLR